MPWSKPQFRTAGSTSAAWSSRYSRAFSVPGPISSSPITPRMPLAGSRRANFFRVTRMSAPSLKQDRRRSKDIVERAEKLLVGGVNSPVRAFRSVGGDPLIIERGQGQYLYDADGHQLLDYVCSWGAMLLGHAHSAVTR